MRKLRTGSVILRIWRTSISIRPEATADPDPIYTPAKAPPKPPNNLGPDSKVCYLRAISSYPIQERRSVTIIDNNSRYQDKFKIKIRSAAPRTIGTRMT